MFYSFFSFLSHRIFHMLFSLSSQKSPSAAYPTSSLYSPDIHLYSQPFHKVFSFLFLYRIPKFPVRNRNILPLFFLSFFFCLTFFPFFQHKTLPFYWVNSTMERGYNYFLLFSYHHAASHLAFRATTVSDHDHKRQHDMKKSLLDHSPFH